MPGIKTHVKKLLNFKLNKFSPDLDPGTLIKAKYVVDKNGQLFSTGRLLNTEKRFYNKTEYLKVQ